MFYRRDFDSCKFRWSHGEGVSFLLFIQDPSFLFFSFLFFFESTWCFRCSSHFWRGNSLVRRVISLMNTCSFSWSSSPVETAHVLSSSEINCKSSVCQLGSLDCVQNGSVRVQATTKLFWDFQDNVDNEDYFAFVSDFDCSHYSFLWYFKSDWQQQ